MRTPAKPIEFPSLCPPGDPTRVKLLVHEFLTIVAEEIPTADVVDPSKLSRPLFLTAIMILNEDRQEIATCPNPSRCIAGGHQPHSRTTGIVSHDEILVHCQSPGM